MPGHKEHIVELDILGRKIRVMSEEDDDYIKEVEEYLNEKMGEIKESTKAVATIDLALLIALNVTSEFLKVKKAMEEAEKSSEDLIAKIDRRTF